MGSSVLARHRAHRHIPPARFTNRVADRGLKPHGAARPRLRNGRFDPRAFLAFPVARPLTPAARGPVRQSQNLLCDPVDEYERPVEVEELDAVGGGFKQTVEQLALFASAAAQLQLGDRHIGERLELGLVLVRELGAWLEVDDAHRAKAMPVWRAHGRAGIKPDMRGPAYKRAGVHARIARRVEHHHHLVPLDGLGAEGPVARCLARSVGHARLDPLPVAIDQSDLGDGRPEHGAGKVRQPVEAFLVRRVQDVEAAEGC